MVTFCHCHDSWSLLSLHNILAVPVVGRLVLGAPFGCVVACLCNMFVGLCSLHWGLSVCGSRSPECEICHFQSGLGAHACGCVGGAVVVWLLVCRWLLFLVVGCTSEIPRLHVVRRCSSCNGGADWERGIYQFPLVGSRVGLV